MTGSAHIFSTSKTVDKVRMHSLVRLLLYLEFKNETRFDFCSLFYTLQICLTIVNAYFTFMPEILNYSTFLTFVLIPD